MRPISEQRRAKVVELLDAGHTAKAIADELAMPLANVYKIQAIRTRERLGSGIGKGGGAGPVKIYTAEERAALQAQMEAEARARAGATPPAPPESAASVVRRAALACKHRRRRRDPLAGAWRCLDCRALVEAPRCEHGVFRDEACAACGRGEPIAESPRRVVLEEPDDAGELEAEDDPSAPQLAEHQPPPAEQRPTPDEPAPATSPAEEPAQEVTMSNLDTARKLREELERLEAEREEKRAALSALAGELEQEAREIRALLGAGLPETAAAMAGAPGAALAAAAARARTRGAVRTGPRGSGRLRILEAVGREPTARADIIAAVPDIDPSTVGGALAALCAQGVIEKVARATYRRVA